MEIPCASVVMTIPAGLPSLTTENAIIPTGIKNKFMIAMEHVPINCTPAMENVLRDMLSVVDIATVNHIMTSISIFVKAVENASQRQLLATTPASPDTISATTITTTMTVMKYV